MELNDSLIRRQSNDVTFSRGMIYFLQGNVGDIEVDGVAMGEDFIHVTAEVTGQCEDFYEPEVVLYKNGGIRDFYCDCGSFHDFCSHGQMCKHIVALLLKYSRVKDRQVKAASRIDSLVHYIKDSLVQEKVAKTLVNLQVKFCMENMRGIVNSVELKIGENKLYVIKNMRSFLENIEQGSRDIEFGKNFTYSPDFHYFNDRDRKLLELLVEVYENDVKVRDGYYVSYGGGSKFLSGKKAYLTDTQMKRFLKVMQDGTMQAEIGSREYDEVSIVEGDLPLDFNLQVKKNSIMLKMDRSIPVPLNGEGDYFFYEGIIYKPSLAQKNIFKPFHHEIASSKTSSIKFSLEDGEKIASYIIPSLKKISRNIDIDKELKKNFHEEPLKLSVYLDKENDFAKAVIKYGYGNVELDPFNEQQKSSEGQVLIRDIDGEMNAVAVLKSFGFEEENKQFILKDEEKLVGFLTEGISKLQQLGEIYYSEGFKNIRVHSSSSIKSSVKLNSNDLLEFSFSIEGVEKTELSNILKALRQRKKYYKLKKGGFVDLDTKELKDIGNMIEYLNIKDSDLQKDKVELSKFNALYIDQNLKGNAMTYVERNKNFRELVNNIRDIGEMDYEVPANLDKIMRGYQKFGFKWFKTLASCGFGGILADEMGLGKTLQAISFIASECGEGAVNKKPSLVVAPTSLVYNWKSEIEKFSPDLKALVISGSKDEREAQRKAIEESDIVITSYPLIRRDIDEYRDMKFKYCILDEAQQIKNAASMSAQSVKEIKAEAYFALTGTPLENSLMELWSIFDFIMPGYLSTHGKFSKDYEVPIVKGKDPEVLKELNKKIKPFILRRLKSEVIKELPPKIEHKVVVEMTEEQKKLYAAYLAQVKEEIQDEIKQNGFNRSKIQILSALTRLRQMCCDPSIFVDNFQGESGKMLALDDIIEESIDGGHRILLFSQFTSLLKRIEDRFKSKGIEYMYLDGQTKSETRGQLVKEFNEGKGSVFLISLKAGGTGLNLTGADVVIHFDPWWNPAVEAQASDRAHRIGQKKTVEVIKLIARGTIEEKIYDLQEKKKEIIKNVIDDDKNEDFLISQMSEEELKDILS